MTGPEGTVPLILGDADRARLWARLIEAIEEYARRVEEQRVAPELDPEGLRRALERFDFAGPMDPVEALDFVVDGLWLHQTHTPHPRYYGLFNPAPTAMGIAADALVAAFNPQLAAWSHSPLAIEIEAHLLRAFAEKFGYDAASSDGTFCSGGAEANHTALLAALAATFPDYAERGLRAAPAQPIFYVSSEGHHSFLKAARLSGLGTAALREIPVDGEFRMRADLLEQAIRRDRQSALAPFLVVATAGTTSAGAVDPIAEIAEVGRRERLFFHVDAAWAGAAALVPELAPMLSGIEGADSITFDAHKWLSVPMGAGLYITRHADLLDSTFRTAAGYMPREARGLAVVDPYAHSMQWSRRFIGLKLFLSLAVAGWAGYAEVLRHQTAMGELLRRELEASGWTIVNRTSLPLVCFADGRHPRGREMARLEEVCRSIVSSGRAWISTVNLAGSTPALRACITNYRTGPDDIRALAADLDTARATAR